MINDFISKLGQSVKLTELFDYLGMTPTYYNRWVEKEILNNPYLIENKDYCTECKYPGVGRKRNNYFISIDSAKKICMSMLKTNKKAKDIYVYLMSLSKTEVLIPVVNRKEILFEINLKEILDGITNIVSQYRVLNYSIDFYLPEYNIAIEYDENFHYLQQEKDIERQNKISEILNCKFIRVKEYCEQSALNIILKHIMNK